MDKVLHPRAVKFDQFGGVDVLDIIEVDRPAPGIGQALVRVRAAGINIGESSIREGKLEKIFPTTFPSGEGSDLAGIVDEIGEGVGKVSVGDEVIGFSNNRDSHADYVLVDADQLIPRPAEVPWEQAGALFVVGSTAYAAVAAVGLKSGDTVVVSGAAGGVGSVTVQLAKNAGAKVIGLSGEANHKWLSDHGIVPVTYGEGMEDRIRQASDGKVDAFIDTQGGGYVELAIKLGISPDRIDTIIDFEAAEKYGVKTDGSEEGAKAEVLSALAEQIATGRLEIPIAKVYQLDKVRDAYSELEQHHTHGKIVLVP